MKGKKSKKEKAESLQKIILLSVNNNLRTGQLLLRDSLKLTSPDAEAAKTLLMAERAVNECLQEIVELIEALYY